MKTTTFVIGAVCALVLGLILGWAGRGLLTYPTSSATDTAFQDWRLVCPAAIQKDGSCQMTDDLLDSKSHQEVARLIMGKEKGALVLGITLRADRLRRGAAGRCQTADLDAAGQGCEHRLRRPGRQTHQARFQHERLCRRAARLQSQ